MEVQNRIFVGGIPVRVDKKTIVEFFSQFGTVKYCKIKKNSKTGRSLGYAYLTFENPDSLVALVDRQIEFCGRICECKQVFRKTELKDELAKEKRKKLLVYDLDPAVNNNDLKEYFESLTSISHAYVVKDPESILNKGYGYIIFKKEEDLEIFCQKKLVLRLAGKTFKYSNEFHVPPKRKKDGCLKTCSNNGESIRRSGVKQRKGSQKAKGEQGSSESVSNSISMEDSDENSNNPSAGGRLFEGEGNGGMSLSRPRVKFLASQVSARITNSKRDGAIVNISPPDAKDNSKRPESSLETENGKLLTDKGTGGTKTTRETGPFAQALEGPSMDSPERWVQVLRASLSLDTREANYKFNRSQISLHFGYRRLPRPHTLINA